MRVGDQEGGKARGKCYERWVFERCRCGTGTWFAPGMDMVERAFMGVVHAWGRMIKQKKKGMMLMFMQIVYARDGSIGNQG
jgi:hypothetical protein